MSECITCGASIEVSENAESGEIIECSECGTELEVRSTNPLKLEKAPEESEDWGE